MADTKQTKTIGEHHAASELARRGWAPAFTRDGLERTDILAVLTEGQNRRLVEVQVKTARGAVWNSISWPLGPKSQGLSLHEREYFIMVAVPHERHPSASKLRPTTLAYCGSGLDRAHGLAHRSGS